VAGAESQAHRELAPARLNQVDDESDDAHDCRHGRDDAEGREQPGAQPLVAEIGLDQVAPVSWSCQGEPDGRHRVRVMTPEVTSARPTASALPAR
jgi:hypothetical protein